MNELTLNLKESHKIDFDADITGITTQKVSVSLVISTPIMDLSFGGTYSEGVALFELPILSDYVSVGTYSAKLVFVIAGDKYFEPMALTIRMINPISISTSLNTTSTAQVDDEPEVSVTMNHTEECEMDDPIATVEVKKDMLERMRDSLDDIKKTSSLKEMTAIYRSRVLLNESSTVSDKDAFAFIDAFCVAEFNKPFRELI